MPALADQLTAKLDRAEEILAAAEAAEREVTAEEATQLDALETEAKALKTNIESLERQRGHRTGLRELRDWTKRPAPRVTAPEELGDEAARRSAFPMPSLLKRRSHRLQCFHGPEAAEEAYVAGQFYLAALWGRRDAANWLEKHGHQLVMSEGVEGKGGYLVPDILESTIIDLRELYGVFRRNTRVHSMASEVVNVPRRAGGLTAYWVGENDEITASDKAWDNVRLTARKLAALTRYSSELAQDAILSVADDLTREIAYAFSVAEDNAGFLGTGISTYGGIVGLISRCAAATATVVTALAGNTAFSTLDLVDFESMIGKLPSYPGIDPKWFIHKAAWAASMMRLADAAGGVTYTELTTGRRVPMFLGYPVEFVPSMNSTLTAQVSTSGLCYFGDLRMAATLGDRRGISLAGSVDRYFELSQMAIRGTERVDIVVHDVGDTSVAGAMIMLATPGS